MTIKEELNQLLNAEYIQEAKTVTKNGISDDAVVLLKAFIDNNKFFIKLNSDSDAMDELETLQYIKNSKITNKGTEFIELDSTIKLINKIGK